MGGHEGRLLGPGPVIPVLEVPVEFRAAHAGQASVVHEFHRHGHAPPRGEQHEVRQQQSEAASETEAQTRRLVGPCIAEGASPNASGANQNHMGPRKPLKKVMRRPRRTHDFHPVSLGPARWVNQEALPPLQAGDHRVDHRQGAPASVAAVFAQVGHLQRLDQAHERIEQGVAVHGRGDQRPHRLAEDDVAGHQGRIDVGGVVRHHQRRAGEIPKLLQTLDAHRITQAEHGPLEPPKERPRPPQHARF